MLLGDFFFFFLLPRDHSALGKIIKKKKKNPVSSQGQFFNPTASALHPASLNQTASSPALVF